MLKEIGRAIRKARIEAKLTQTQLANEFGEKHHGFVSRIENGKSQLSFEKLKEILTILNKHEGKFFQDVASEYFSKIPSKK